MYGCRDIYFPPEVTKLNNVNFYRHVATVDQIVQRRAFKGRTKDLSLAFKASFLKTAKKKHGVHMRELPHKCMSSKSEKNYNRISLRGRCPESLARKGQLYNGSFFQLLGI